jgi:Cdc6-like AAA superfamily ATPase
MKTFDEFVNQLNFKEYPFSTYTTENEKGREDELFVQPSDYSPIIQSFNQEVSIILIGDRGTGKTAILHDFERNLDKSKTLFCTIDDFSSLPQSYSSVELYKFLISKISVELFNQLAIEPKKIKLVKQEEKVLLSYLLKNFVSTVSKRIMKEKIEKMQVTRSKRIFTILFNKIRGGLNWGTTVGANVVEEYLARHFKGLPELNTNNYVKDFFPELPNEIDESFNDLDVGYQLLIDVATLIENLKFERIVLLLDKLDEDNRLENNGELISEFAKPLLTDNKLLLNGKIQVIVSMWSIPFNYLTEHIRTQKHYCPLLTWNKHDLVKVLNKRLSSFSNNKLNDFKKLFSDDFNSDFENEIFRISNGNPRDLWHITNKLLRTQHKLDSYATKISNEAVTPALEDFVSSFNYYEYYPRKNNARSNTMDFYSYTAHLLKLDNPVFSRNQLNEKAGTGSSTQNYVTGMERMGLIEKINQESGNILYRIKDPKVVYALKNNVIIERNN